MDIKGTDSELRMQILAHLQRQREISGKKKTNKKQFLYFEAVWSLWENSIVSKQL